MAALDETDRPRLEALHRLRILDTEEEAAFDRIARLAAKLLAAPAAALAFVDRDRVWVKARVGECPREEPRDRSLCALGLREEFFELPDLAADPRCAALPHVQAGVGSFAGASIDVEGARVGMLCVYAPQPRSPLAAESRALLCELAALAADALAHRAAVQRERQRHPDRLAPVQALAAALAHEINNPLSFVLANVAFAREELAAGALDGVEEALAEAAEGAARVGELVRGLIAFSGPAANEAPVDLRRALEAAVRASKPSLCERAQLVTAIGALPKVRGEAQRLEQVFLQLLLNAGQALPEEAVGTRRVELRAFTGPSGHAVIEIEETGGSRPAGAPGTESDPPLTTRSIGGGLGLSICHGLVATLDGELEIETTEGRGTLFRVRLPPFGADQ